MPRNRDLERFVAGIVSTLGLRVDEHNEDQISQALRQGLERTGHDTVDGYVSQFESDDRFASNELREIAKELTVPETYFFRHPEQFQALAEVALPAQLKARAEIRQLNILSAGCASGEEPYTVAAIIADLPGIETWTVRIWGVDINVALLEKARSAKYSAWSLRTVPECERGKYFHFNGKHYILNPGLRSLVRFKEHNLLCEDGGFLQTNYFDVIFCRNVTIYLEPAAIKSLITRLTQALAPGGFLFLGHSETLRGISQDFHLRHSHGAFYYQRLLPDEKPATGPWACESRSANLAVAPPMQPQKNADWISVIEGANTRIAGLAGGSVRERREVIPALAGCDNSTGSSSCLPGVTVQQLREVRELVQQERFDDALRAIQALPPSPHVDPDLMLLEALVLANKGEISLAEQVCKRLLKTDELRPGAHYLIAVCQERRGDLLSAAEHDQRAIYLDPAFAMPRLHLGLVAKRLGDLATARRELAEALALLAREDISRILLFGGGFTREALIRFCQAQYDRCGGPR
ncbi:MAG: methyltransferase domain-containing protein [Acidobacteria bacterium]|nr:MAG: methyltransferase domain-containing protein [Acidobacteriota bacterium]